MLFNSSAFLLFFPVVTLLYFMFPHRLRWGLLLAASCFFYMYYVPVYILILAGTILIDYIAGLCLETTQNPIRRKAYLILSLTANIGILFVFKYYNFIVHNFDILASYGKVTYHLPILRMALPIGLSFHTFQAMSYIIEVYRGNQRAERHFGIYALYVLFYPQLVAGPIERPQNILHQFHKKIHFSYDDIVSGLRFMLWGMFKKVVIADRLSLLTDPIFNKPHNYTASAIVCAAVMFSFQILCDFSGYSDIAIGAARVMGFQLMKNFNHPYQSAGIAAFWRNWHISLSTWFRDYLYIPLGGNRRGTVRTWGNIFFVFLISGLWHGANWTFIAWGLLHFLYMLSEQITAGPRRVLAKVIGLTRQPMLNNITKQLCTFILVTLAWVFFRANSIWDALYMARKMPYCISEALSSMIFHKVPLNLGHAISDLAIAGALISLLIIVQQRAGRISVPDFLAMTPSRNLRWAGYYLLIFSIIYCGIFQNRQFIYFQF